MADRQRNIYRLQSQVVACPGNMGTVPGSSTRYILPFVTGVQTGGSTTFPVAGVWSKLYVVVETAQPAGGTGLTFTLYLGSSATALTANCPAGGQYVYSDLTHRVSHPAGQYAWLQVDNNSGSTSGAVGCCTVLFTSIAPAA